MAPWLLAGNPNFDDGFNSVNPLIPCFKEQIRLTKIIEKMLSKLIAVISKLDSLSQEACLEYLNFELCSWHDSLPEDVKWNRWASASHSVIPCIATLQ